MTETLRLSVTGMTCGGCERAVTTALLRKVGVTDAKASHADERVDVTFDPAIVNPASLREAIESLGYRIEP